jgi:hypothetical protein
MEQCFPEKDRDFEFLTRDLKIELELPKVHLKKPPPPDHGRWPSNLGICGSNAAKGYITENEKEVTCRRCLRELASGWRK